MADEEALVDHRLRFRFKRGGADVEHVVEMMIDATGRYNRPLTEERLVGWHAALFPTGRSGMTKIKTGAWRDQSAGPMQIISGALGKEKVHYEAPEAGQLKREMKLFLDWFNARDKQDPVIKSALAHFWFVTIHPFEDGNGRIARAIADLALARSEQSAQRFYSMSAQIRKERNAYHDVLEKTQRGALDITDWLTWFLECLDRGACAYLVKSEGKKHLIDAIYAACTETAYTGPCMAAAMALISASIAMRRC